MKKTMKYDFYGKIIRDWGSVPKDEDDGGVMWADFRFAYLHKLFIENGIGWSDLRFANIQDCRFFWDGIGVVEGEGSQWKNVRFSGADTSGVNMPRAKLENVIWQQGGTNPSRFAKINSSSFYEASLKNCTFSEVQFWGVFFQSASFEDCTFHSCEIQETCFRNAHFKNVLFEYCIFEGVDFEGCTFENCRFIGNDDLNIVQSEQTLVVVPYEWADDKIEEFVEERGLSFDDEGLAVACPPESGTAAEYMWLFNKHKSSRIILARDLYIKRLNSDPWKELNEELAYALEKSRFPVVEMY